jgi:hypothetical protein
VLPLNLIQLTHSLLIQRVLVQVIPHTITLEAYGSSNPRSPILEAVERLDNERLSKLKLQKYKETPTDDEEDDLN